MSSSSANSHLPRVLAAAERLSTSLANPTLMVTLHRDLEGLKGKDGKSLARSRKQYALRWGTFTMVFAALEGFFNDALTVGPHEPGLFPSTQTSCALKATYFRRESSPTNGVSGQ